MPLIPVINANGGETWLQLEQNLEITLINIISMSLVKGGNEELQTTYINTYRNILWFQKR